MPRAKAAATAAALVALMALVGAAAFATARDEPPVATTSTSTSTTTTSPPTSEEVTLAIATALSEGLDVPLEDTEARCVADGMLTQLGRARLEAMAGDAVEELTEAERAELVRTVVLCVPPEKAAALLSSVPSTTIVVELPDEGTDP